MKLREHIALFFGHLWASLPFYSRNRVDSDWFKGYTLGLEHGRAESGVSRRADGRFARLMRN
jgi:hypothetical protein